MSYPIAGNVKTHSAKGYSVEHALVVSRELFHVEQICASDVFLLAAAVVFAALNLPLLEVLILAAEGLMRCVFVLSLTASRWS